ncbi:hypothetical protein DFJ58DRAFT_736706 [Suillus subalutaceus]|uniref:uncharacterized protein n=1 Tax=Suillus subalutaceus TaxID=48586 RepID=UPI001B881707|nr:uncharacterized protein DFJ58DRAFT_736706 [Suillus subalutaceus]KAG1831202.1 hypothetical protein DFJ58DRAFT_736706 [Suillus subalutaceus]
MSIDEPSFGSEPGELADTHWPPHSQQGWSGHSSRGRGGRTHPPRQREPNSDALSAFTHVFHAEAQASKPTQRATAHPPAYHGRLAFAEELATHKEAHAFDQLVCAEQSQDAAPYRPCGRNLTLDHRGHPRGQPFALNRAQIIADATNNAATLLATAPAPAVLVPDPGPDVSEIIAAAEQLDLEQTVNMPDITHEDVFGRVVSVGLLVTNVLTLAILLAAFASVTRS